MRILINTSEPMYNHDLKIVFNKTNIDYDLSPTFSDVLMKSDTGAFNLIIIASSAGEVELADKVKEIRQARIFTPIMVLSSNYKTDAKVATLEAGADDYVVAPFESSELLARTNALIRRGEGIVNPILSAGPLNIDLSARTVSVNKQRVGLTGKEYAILEMLFLRKGMTLSKEMFITHIYGSNEAPDHKIIDVFVCKLRKKLFEAGAPASGCIETVWGRGYALRDPVDLPETLSA